MIVDCLDKDQATAIASTLELEFDCEFALTKIACARREPDLSRRGTISGRT